MEIQSSMPISQSPLINKETSSTSSSDVWKAAGAYFELKEKSKAEHLTVSEEALVNAIDKANQAVQGTPHEFFYKLHESGKLIVQIRNKETHEVLKEIPSEKMVELVNKLQELAAGVVIDEKG
jgi:flagellar protein FlaG